MPTPSRFVWHDLGTRDVDAALGFYGELFGWTFDPSENGSYHHLRAGSRMIGGLRRKDDAEPGPPSWLGYVLVDDVPAAVERAKAHGGRVHVPPTTMADVGTFAVVADPTGGVVAPWRSARQEENEEEEDGPPALSTFCWDELLTTDPGAATSFYTGVFGWGHESRDTGGAGAYTVFDRPGTKDPMREGRPVWAAGATKVPPGVPYSSWLAYVRVEDADATAERATRLGAKLTVPPTDVPGIGRYGSLLDPEGAALAFLGLRPD